MRLAEENLKGVIRRGIASIKFDPATHRALEW